MAFLAAGSLLLGSLVVPIGLSPVTRYGWVVGLLLVGLGVVSAAIGLLGLSLGLERPAPLLAFAGAATAVIAGVAAVALVAVSAIAIGWIAAFGEVPAVPKPAFLVLASLMAVGYAVGLLVTGLAVYTSGVTSVATIRFLLLGGSVLLVAAVGALLRMGIGIGLPPWTVPPAILVAGLATVGVGVSAGADAGPTGGSE